MIITKPPLHQWSLSGLMIRTAIAAVAIVVSQWTDRPDAFLAIVGTYWLVVEISRFVPNQNAL